jgi:hypothetical protein
MTVIDRLRSVVPGGDVPEGAAAPGRGWARGAVVGVLTGLVSLLVVLGPVLLAWRAEPGGATAGVATGVGAGLWLLVSGAHADAAGATIALTPLLGLALLVVLARYGAREAIVRVSIAGPHWWGLLAPRLAAALAGWWAGYAVVVLAAAWVASGGPFPPVPLTLAVPLVVVPLLGVVLALRPVVADDPEVLGPRAGVLRVPDAVRRGFGPGLRGLLLVLAVGTLVVLAAVALSWDRVRSVQHGLEAGGTGDVVLVLAQVGMVPNLALWVVSFLAGPGFQVVDGAGIAWGGAESGLLPMVPVFGALPQPGAFPVLVPALSVLALVAVGAWVGNRALGTVARLSRVRTKLAVAVAACATTATGAGLLDAFGGGSLGRFRLTDVGAPALTLGLCLFGWLLLGAVLAVLRDAWRLRR